MNTSSRILVTGASGFIGRAVCKRLEKEGYDVLPSVRRPNPEFQSSPHFVSGDIGASTDWRSALVFCNTVIHLAARVHVMSRGGASADEYLRVNHEGTINLARQAADAGISRFLFVSSIKVNGEYTCDNPFTEQARPSPQDPYAISKWQSEQDLLKLGESSGMEIVILRPPLVYGPGVKANFYKLLQLVSKGWPLPLSGLTNARSLLYVDNLADALVFCTKHAAAAGQTYLISDEGAVSTPELLQMIADAMSKPIRLFPIPMAWLQMLAKLLGKSDNFERLTQSLLVDPRKLHELGWQPPVPMKIAIQRTVEWFLEVEGPSQR